MGVGKDGKIDIDKCLEKFEELKALRRKNKEWEKKSQEMQAFLNKQVDQFFKDMAPIPPGFVIRTYGDNGWGVKYEANRLSREKVGSIVAAIREAIK